MKDFWFQNSTKIIFGHNKISQLGDILKPYGTKALFVYGKESIHQNGLYDLIKNNVESCGIRLIDHGGVKSNPVISHARIGIGIVREGQIECILAVGGGSVIDEAKVIAAGACTEHDVWDFFALSKKPSNALPIVVVPTISATGSEMNGGAVISNEETEQKLVIGAPCLYPKIAVLDPELTYSVSPQYTVFGIADAFSHALEPYFNGSERDTTVQDRMAEGVLLSIIDISNSLVVNPGDSRFREDMMLASIMAHNGILSMGLGRVRYENHIIAHSIGAIFNVPHGAALSVVIPGWMQYVLKRKLRKFSQFATRVMKVDGAIDDADTAYKGVIKLREWFNTLGCPVTLGELGISESAISGIVENAAPFAIQGGMEDIDEKGIEDILRLCL